MKQVEILAEFLDQELERGRLRPSLNTTLTAETIIGTMHHFAWLEIIAFRRAGDANPPLLPSRASIDQVVPIGALPQRISITENAETQEALIQGFIDTLWKGIIANPESY